MIQYDELPFLTENKDASEIALMYEDLCDKRTIFRESCKNFIFDFIPDWASEDDPYECDLCFETCLECWKTQSINAIWRDENGNLAFDIDNGVGVDYFRDEELLQIVEQLDKS